MTTLPPASDFTGASVNEGAFKSALTDLRGFLAGLLGDDGLTATALVTLGALGGGVASKSAAYSVTTADRGKLIDADGTWVLDLPAAASAGAGFLFALRNSGTGTITVDPSGAEQIDAQTTRAVVRGEGTLIICTGTAWITLGPPMQASALDTTPGRLMPVGAFGLGATGDAPEIGDIAANDTPAGQYRFDAGTTGYAGLPSEVTAGGAGIIGIARHGAALLIQTVRANDMSGGVWWRAYSGGGWLSWQRQIDHGGLLGTVSETGGVPTGAVIERGTNANGEYVRFADGTQICSHAVDLGSITLAGAGTWDDPYRTSPYYSWTYPAAFAAQPTLMTRGHPPSDANGQRQRQRCVVSNGLVLSSASYQLCIARVGSDSTADDFELHMLALGRWF